MTDPACTISVKKDGYDRVATLEYANEEYVSTLRPNPWLRRIVDRFDRLAKEHPGACDREDLLLLGEGLFSILFDHETSEVLRRKGGDPVVAECPGKTLGDIFCQKIDDHKANHPGNRLRISLEFESGVDDLANLPWEFLRVGCGEDGYFLADAARKLSLTRVLKPPLKDLKPPENVRMLVVLSQPRELDYKQTRSEFENFCTDLQGKLGLDAPPDSLFKPTFDEFKTALEADPPYSIVHFIGHGKVENAESRIALHLSEDKLHEAMQGDPQANPDEAEWVKVETLKSQLDVDRPPLLFFLQTCSSGRAGPGVGAHRSAAQTIARADVPFVVAMQNDIKGDDAKLFVDSFYSKLGEPSTVDEAVMFGRAALGRARPSYSHPRFGNPVVYLRSEQELLLFPDKGRNGGQTARASARQDCPYCGDRKLPPIGTRWKTCPCVVQKPLKYCENGHPNQIDATECNVAGCDKARLESAATPMRPAMPRDRGLA